MFKHILVPVDGSHTSMLAVSKAAGLAKAFGSAVTAVYVIDPVIGEAALKNVTKGGNFATSPIILKGCAIYSLEKLKYFNLEVGE